MMVDFYKNYETFKETEKLSLTGMESTNYFINIRCLSTTCKRLAIYSWYLNKDIETTKNYFFKAAKCAEIWHKHITRALETHYEHPYFAFGDEAETIHGNKLYSRKFSSRKTENNIKIKTLKKMTAQGMPIPPLRKVLDLKKISLSSAHSIYATMRL